MGSIIITCCVVLPGLMISCNPEQGTSDAILYKSDLPEDTDSLVLKIFTLPPVSDSLITIIIESAIKLRSVTVLHAWYFLRFRNFREEVGSLSQFFLSGDYPHFIDRRYLTLDSMPGR
jgi:hypothetical protein